jgi:hypothetical protein
MRITDAISRPDRPGVAGPQKGGGGLARFVEVGHERMKAEAAVERYERARSSR